MGCSARMRRWTASQMWVQGLFAEGCCFARCERVPLGVVLMSASVGL